MTLIVPVPPPTTAEEPITSSAFWPAVDPVKIREDQRIDNAVTPPRLKAAIIEAIATTNQSLMAWRNGQQNQGINTLENVPAEQIDGISIKHHRYLRAVGCLTKALLLERYRDMDTTHKGDKRAEMLTDPIDDCRRDHLNAINDIRGQARSTVELI